jgi:uncharacterized protein (DUF2252 family)
MANNDLAAAAPAAPLPVESAPNGAAAPVGPAPKVEHFTPEERAARGKAARAEVPRSSHADWDPSPMRADPVEVLEAQAASREPTLVPIRYGRMLVSPFTFYRGAAALMAGDLSGGPRSGIHTQLCGDAHLMNFGSYAAPDRRMVFGINDFDESLPGPFEWDVKRLVASFAVAGRDRGFSPKVRAGINTEVVRGYREAMAGFAAMRNLDIWYARLDIDARIKEIRGKMDPEAVARMDKNVEKARTKDSLKAFSKLVTLVDGEPRITSDPPLIVPIDELVPPGHLMTTREAIARLIRSYRRSLPGDRRKLLERFRYVDMARKVVGVGSVGTRAWIVLMLGRDGDDPLLLQAKEAQVSVLEPYLGKSAYNNHGQRVVEGQRLMQAESDILLGWLRTQGIDGVERDFYFRQLWDAKGSALVDLMEPPVMTSYAKLCGWTLAKAHARSGDAIAISAYMGTSDTFDKSMAVFAEKYADQNERDYAALKAAVESGRVEAQTGL